jgi:internalin A
MNIENHTPHEALKRINTCVQNPKQTTLDLSKLGLTEVPKELENASLTHLIKLDLSSNLISEIKRLEKLTNLYELNLSLNEINKIEGLDKLSNLHELNLYSNQTKRIEGLAKLTNLVVLDLDSNQVSKIEGLDKLVALSALNLSRNQVSKIEGMDKLAELSVLYLSGNQISRIEGLNELTKLSILYLSGNQINRIEGLDWLRKLSGLDISSNRVSKIEGLDKLASLTELYLSYNYITRVEGLESLSTLFELDLSFNQISSIEELDIQLVKRLTYIDLTNNLIENIPIKDFTDKQAILGYLKSIKQDRLVPNHHLKLNIIGRGRIGKTQLLKYFDGKPYTKNEEETHGTNTAKYNIPNTNYQVTIWDFGGQSYHHGFHYLFLRPKDFYLTLWRNCDEHEPDYAYWLGTAHFFAKEKVNEKYTAPLLLVQNVWNYTDKREEKKNFVPDEVAYPNSNKVKKYQLVLHDVFAIDVSELFNKKKKNIANNFFLQILHEKLIEHTKQIKEIPEKFVAIKKELDNKAWKGFNIKIEDFKKTHATGFDESAFAYLLQYLEFTGNILHFREVDALNDYVFPNPPALSDWIYTTVLNDEFKKFHNGRISKKELKKKVGNEKATIFLSLMGEFRLIFEQPFYNEKDDDKDTYYIIPQFLPDYKHSFKQVLLELLPYTFSIQFPDFIHEGKFFKFITQYGKYAKDNSAYWKYGLLFSFELDKDKESKTSQQKKQDNLQVLAYYMSERRQVMVHIEDKKGRSKVAQELFDFFALEEFTWIRKPENIKSANTTKKSLLDALREKAGSAYDIRVVDPKRPLEKIQDDIQLSTNGHNFIDVKETMKNIKANNFFGICTQTQTRIKLDFMAINLLSDDSEKKLRVFFSYSHKNEIYRDELDKHFTMLRRSGRIETWHDRKIVAGENWDNKIREQLETADLVLLMISADFLYSDYIWEQELGIVRKRFESSDGIKVIPIFVRPCDTEGLDFMKLQGGQRDYQSQLPWVSSSLDRDKTYTDIVQEIKKVIDSI